MPQFTEQQQNEYNRLKKVIKRANDFDGRENTKVRAGNYTPDPNPHTQELIDIGLWDDEGCFLPDYKNPVFNRLSAWYESEYC